jgi:hypothetical protein
VPEIVYILQVFAEYRVLTSKLTLPISNTKMSSSPAFESMHPVRDDTRDLPTLPAQGHPLVITHLRRSKRVASGPPPATILPITPKRRRPAKKAVRNASSPAPAMSSPYALCGIQIAGPAVLSPFKFDPDFYQQGSILNGNIDVDKATCGAANNRHMKAMRGAHEHIIESAKLDEYKPLEMPNPPRLLRTYLPDSANIKDPASFFEIFVKDEDFDMIMANTNKYAEQYSVRYPNASQRHFKPTNRTKIKIYFAILIYMGIHKINNPKEH